MERSQNKLIPTLSRDTSMDMVAGLLVIHMILGHVIQRTYSTNILLYHIMDYLYFFMPWFFYKSGMFFHKSTLRQILENGTRRLLIPYIFYSVIGIIVLSILKLYKGDISWTDYIYLTIKQFLQFGSCEGNLPLWFLLTLFIVRIIAFLIVKSRELLLLTIVVCYVSSMFYFYYDLKSPYYIGNILTGLLFFCSGYLLKEYQYNRYVATLSMIVYLLFCVFGLTVVDMRSNKLISGDYFFYPFTSIAGIVFINNIFKFFKFDIQWLRLIGHDSMNYYVIHWILITLFFIIFTIFDFPTIGVMSVSYLVIALIVSLPFFNYLMSNFDLEDIFYRKRNC